MGRYTFGNECPCGRPGRLNFRINFRCQFGQSIAVSGNHAALALWNVSRSPLLSWNAGDFWTGSVNFHIGDTIAFKFVVVDSNTRNPIRWESISNRRFTINATTSNVNTAWDDATVYP